MMLNIARRDRWILIALLLAGAWLRMDMPPVEKTSPDEVVYTYYAKYLRVEGLDFLKNEFQYYIANQKHWEHPPPVRIGYLFTLAIFMNPRSAEADLNAGVMLSCLTGMAGLVLCLWFGLRFFNSAVTAGALLFLAVSPVDLAVSGRVWPDGPLAFLSGLLLYIAHEIHRRPDAYSLQALFAATGACAALFKEAGLFVWALIAVGLVTAGRSRWSAKTLLGFGLLNLSCLTLGLGAIAAAGGGGATVWTAWERFWGHGPENEFMLKYQSGPWFSLLKSLWLAGPAAAFLAALGLVGSLRHRPSRGVALYTLIFVVGLSVLPHYKNLRLAAPIFIPYYLTAGWGLWHLIEGVRRLVPGRARGALLAGVAVCLTGLAAADYLNFKEIFITHEAIDLVPAYFERHSLYALTSAP